MRAEPRQLRDAPRCGAKTRGARGGRPCRSPAMANGRCRMHGGRSGGPTGSRNGAYKHGRFTKEAREVRAWVRGLARDADVLTATAMRDVGLRPLRAIRRKAHVKRALRAAKAKEGQK
jgi:hypothetical protein